MGSEAGADAALVQAAQAGDARAFGELYERYRQPLYRYCLARSESPHEAEDLVSDVFLKAMESLTRYRDQGLPFIAFLYRVARNAAIDRSRKAKGSSLFEMTVEPRSTVDVEGDAARSLEMDAVLGAMRKIKPEYREVILLRFVEGYSAADVAKLLEKGEKAVWNLQQRGLERLRVELRRTGQMALAGAVADR
ncbi:MAG: RNA polymerase sigma factor [Chloroflexota bacterium]